MTVTFTITLTHLMLMQKMYVGWNDDEFGAPEINPKRPYGNSAVLVDVAEILGLRQMISFEFGDHSYKVDHEDWWYDMPDELADVLAALHAQTRIALQICLVVQKFEVGTYQKTDRYNDRSWVKIPEDALN